MGHNYLTIVKSHAVRLLEVGVVNLDDDARAANRVPDLGATFVHGV